MTVFDDNVYSRHTIYISYEILLGFLELKMFDNCEFFIELRSFDSLNLYPKNIASCFRIQLIGRLKFNGDWKLSLRDLVINCKDTDTEIEGRDIYIYTNIIEQSFVGTNYKSLLRRVNSGQGIHNGSRVT